MAGVTQVADGQFLQALGIFQKLLNVLRCHALLCFNEILPLWGGCKPSKEICLYRVTEKSVLGFPAVVVHAIPQNAEVEVLFLLDIDQEKVLLVVSMSIYESDHALDDFGFLSPVEDIIAHEAWSKHLINISTDRLFNFPSRNAR